MGSMSNIIEADNDIYMRWCRNTIQNHFLKCHDKTRYIREVHTLLPRASICVGETRTSVKLVNINVF